MEYVFAVFLLLAVLRYLYSKSSKKDPNLVELPYGNGSMTKVEYQGHSYICWTCNLSSELIHDPDCICKKTINN